jgi:hypothetical protein
VSTTDHILALCAAVARHVCNDGAPTEREETLRVLVVPAREQLDALRAEVQKQVGINCQLTRAIDEISLQPGVDAGAWATKRGPEFVVERVRAEVARLTGERDEARTVAERYANAQDVGQTREMLLRERAERAEAERDAARSLLDGLDSQLTRIRVAIDESGVPDISPYPPEEGLSQHEQSLRAGGYVVPQEMRVRELTAERDALRLLVDGVAKAEEARKPRGPSAFSALCPPPHHQATGEQLQATIDACVAWKEKNR